MDTRRDIFQAIADPTRRAIIHLIATKAENLTSISENFDMSRQAVTLHVKILEECGLNYIKHQGRERYCELKPEKLKEVDEWVSYYRTFGLKSLPPSKHLLTTKIDLGKKPRKYENETKEFISGKSS